MAKKKKFRRRPDDPNCPVCVYCGVNPGTEDEHVVAEAFFPSPRPSRSEFILVPACSDCNRGIWQNSARRMNMDEEYARSMLILEWNAGNHPAARKLLNQEVLRSVKHNPSLAKLIVRNPQTGSLTLPSGFIVPDVMSTDVHWPRIRQVIHKITLGLYYHEIKRRLPDDYEIIVEVLSMIGVSQSPKLEDPDIQHLMAQTKVPGPHRLGDGVFSYALIQTNDDDPARVLWVISFYDGVYFLVATRRADQTD